MLMKKAAAPGKAKKAKAIEGMDRFGKVCAELKSQVIDLECLIAA
jgi:hypothetical protein